MPMAEYKLLRLVNTHNTIGELDHTERRLNEMAQEGWRLVTVVGSLHYFEKVHAEVVLSVSGEKPTAIHHW